MDSSPQRPVKSRKTGAERLRAGKADLGVDLLTFWQWSVSDLISNVTRGRLAEFIVARALGCSCAEGVRDEWAPFDLLAPSGVRVEVKSAAFVQSWHQTRPSSIRFGTRRTRHWDADTGIQGLEATRQADVYVFALLAHQDGTTVNPLDVDHWRFYVLPAWLLNARTRGQGSITLRSLEKACETCVTFERLPDTVAAAAASKPS